MKYYTEKEACDILGVDSITLKQLEEEGKIKSIRIYGGMSRYDISPKRSNVRKKGEKTICYCRVSTLKHKKDLERQVAFMKEKYPKCEVIEDIGSGINVVRDGLCSILERAMNGEELTIVVAHIDRLGRFGTDLIELVIKQHGGKIVDLNEDSFSSESELEQDLVTVLTLFTYKMRGLKKYLDKIKADKNLFK